MKKLLKFLTAIALVTLFLGCDIIFFTDDTNNITITNDTGRELYYLYLVPMDSYEYSRDYDEAKRNSVYFGSKDLLGSSETLDINESITIDLNDYSGSSFRLMSFEFDDNYGSYYFYETTVTDSMSSVTVEYSDLLSITY